VSDYSLVPVDHQPDFENVSLVPVDHDPFIEEGEAQQAQAQPQSVPPHAQQPQSSATTGDLPDIGRPLIGDGGQFSAGTAFGNRAADVASKVAYGLMKQIATLPQRAIEASAADVQHLGEDGYTPQAIGPALETAMLMAGSGSLMAERGAIGAFGGKLPASRAAEKGFSGIGTTPNAGPTFAASDHLYPAGPGQRSVFKMPLTGSRKADVALANEMGGFADPPKGYRWHHVDDFDPQTGESTLELVTREAHEATLPHAGSVSQYEKFHGRPYKR
jgi:hypothetical protein